MKRFSLVLLFVVSLAITFSTMVMAQSPSPSQGASEQILVSKSQLPPALLEQIETQSKIDTYGKYVGLGKEVGMAINEGLSALSENAERFANTKPGKFTMFIIAYKVLGKDFLQAIFGILFFVVGVGIFLCMWFKNGITRRIPIEEPRDKTAPKRYEVYRPDESAQIAYVVCFVIFLIIDCIVIFA
ncbi:MAG: hypothetical protein PHH01_00345 [Patescibacteria group bacterium]|nr:hypothetical protein [Patescibacteria group bacterium]